MHKPKAASPVPDQFLIALSYLWSVWLVHVVLRSFQILRLDPYGHPFVGKPDWYLFHAYAMDLTWVFLYPGPFLLFLFLGKYLLPQKQRWVIYTIMAFHSVLLVITVVEQETYRFLGAHLEPSLLMTYGNSASIRELFGIIASDVSIPFLPYILFFGCVPASFGFHFLLRNHTRWAKGYGRRITPVLITICALLCATIYLKAWKGGFRTQKLSPVVRIWRHSLLESRFSKVSQKHIDSLINDYLKHPVAHTPPTMVRPLRQYPYFQVPLNSACQTYGNRWNCDADEDNDGFSKLVDCDDWSAQIHPKARDLPSNGTDENCDNIDEKPYNIVLIFLESHRALNCGFLQKFGAGGSGTPVLDSLAPHANVWTNYFTNGLPTIEALLSVHLGVFPIPNGHIASQFTHINFKGLPAIMGENGYQTHFFSAADPAWDNQTPWLRAWYRQFTYNRSRENDADMFQHMTKWMLKNLSDDKPFFLSAITKVNHYPFNAVKGMPPHPKGLSHEERLKRTMTYAERGLQNMLTAVQNQPWMNRTLFFIMADHGFPLGEHGSSNIGYGLYSENTWIPLLILGKHPKLGGPKTHTTNICQLDIAPTVLDLAGIRAAHHFTGHSIVDTNIPQREVLCIFKLEGLYIHGRHSFHFSLGRLPRENGPEVFDLISDRRESKNIYGLHNPVFDTVRQYARWRNQLNYSLISNNRVIPPDQ